MIGDLAQREDELGGKTLLIVGLGQIGGRLAQLAKAFDMRVIGIRRDRSDGGLSLLRGPLWDSSAVGHAGRGTAWSASTRLRSAAFCLSSSWSTGCAGP
jgi:D-isomer specific 2-hydroxyacid dehydrogenase, NAD binding domain